eukprot:6204888-Pleurochrysis_carterae.AAC.2
MRVLSPELALTTYSYFPHMWVEMSQWGGSSQGDFYYAEDRRRALWSVARCACGLAAASANFGRLAAALMRRRYAASQTTAMPVLPAC